MSIHFKWIDTVCRWLEPSLKLSLSKFLKPSVFLFSMASNYFKNSSDARCRITYVNSVKSNLFILLMLSLFVSGCSLDLANPPRLATATARAAIVPAQPSDTIVIQAPTATPEPGGAAVPPDEIPEAAVESLSVWVNESSPKHREVLNDMAAEFSALSGADVAIQLVSPALLPQLVNTAVLSDTLPDIILHPLEYTAGWVQEGVLDPAAAEAVVSALGVETFDSDAIDLISRNGRPSAIPVDGYYQLLLYRADWFRELNLAPPDTFEAMQIASEQIFDPEEVISGLVIPTESNLVTTHQAFEQMALANNCRLIDESGEVILLEPACEAAIDHYFTTINRFSPPGVQTDTSAINALLEGRTGLIITSPAILPKLAGLDPAKQPTCPECVTGSDGINYLARNTGIITAIEGDAAGAEPAAFGNIRNLGITTGADLDIAQAFASYWLAEGYEKWLAVDSERKVPMRLGTAENPSQFISVWGNNPLNDSSLSLSDIYGEETIARLRDGIASAPRWGMREGHGSLMARLYDELTFSIVLQEMLSGYFNTGTTLREAYRRVIDLITNYAFPVNIDEDALAP
jgi:multiple sugar transport system substrate-binding protein